MSAHEEILDESLNSKDLNVAIAVDQLRPLPAVPAAFVDDGRHDSALMRRVARGDREAFVAAYDLHSRAALALALTMTRNREAAEEVVQETFISLWLRADRYFAERGSLRGFVLGIARHRALDSLRRDTTRARRRASDAGLEESHEAPERTDAEVLRRAEAASVRAALDCLAPAQSEAIELAYFAGLSHSEIADRLDLPLGTVKSRIRIGLSKLRGELPHPVAL